MRDNYMHPTDFVLSFTFGKKVAHYRIRSPRPLHYSIEHGEVYKGETIHCVVKTFKAYTTKQGRQWLLSVIHCQLYNVSCTLSVVHCQAMCTLKVSVLSMF